MFWVELTQKFFVSMNSHSGLLQYAVYGFIRRFCQMFRGARGTLQQSEPFPVGLWIARRHVFPRPSFWALLLGPMRFPYALMAPVSGFELRSFEARIQRCFRLSRWRRRCADAASVWISLKLHSSFHLVNQNAEMSVNQNLWNFQVRGCLCPDRVVGFVSLAAGGVDETRFSSLAMQKMDENGSWWSQEQNLLYGTELADKDDLRRDKSQYFCFFRTALEFCRLSLEPRSRTVFTSCCKLVSSFHKCRQGHVSQRDAAIWSRGGGLSSALLLL